MSLGRGSCWLGSVPAAGDLFGDCEDVISPDELGESAEMVWKSVPGVQTFRMTNRIRTNAELSVFIQNMMRLTRGKGETDVSPCLGWVQE